MRRGSVAAYHRLGGERKVILQVGEPVTKDERHEECIICYIETRIECMVLQIT